ncbi:MAG: oligosaccharide flippase family protein [Pseudomonadota bacterium]
MAVLLNTSPDPDAGEQSSDGGIPSQSQTSMTSKVGRQGALLMSGFAMAQIFAFARNAMIGHWLSKGDFGIAATITLTLQLIETLSDVGSDRLIIQSKDGDDPRLTALAHLTLVIRGLVTGVILYLVAGPVTQALNIAHAQWAFEIASLVPIIKGFAHLDFRWHQRRLNNRPFMLYEVVPQAVATVITLPALYLTPTYAAVPAIVIATALTAVIISHTLATRRYEISFDGTYLNATLSFGWPIWLSALPLVAVYQGDRFLIGGLLGMEALAAYTTAFMITMVPGLLAAKVGNALMLPLLSEMRDNATGFAKRYTAMSETVITVSAAYLTGFMIAGGAVLPLAFGNNYTGLGSLVTILAIMWSLRMIQAVPGMALMATADTKPLLIAGLIRATGLPLAYLAAQSGYGLIGMAACGVIAETLSLVYVTVRTGRNDTSLITSLAKRCLLIAPFVGLAVVMIVWPPVALAQAGALTATLVAVTASTTVAMALICAQPNTRRFLSDTLHRMHASAKSPSSTASVIRTDQGVSQSATGSI